jgi:hypothetical protein
MVRNVTGMVDDTGNDSYYDPEQSFPPQYLPLGIARWPILRLRGDRWDRSAWTRRFAQDTTGSFLSS